MNIERSTLPAYFTEDQLKVLDKIDKDKDNTEKVKKAQIGKDAFLQLMIKQLQHQDPLSPMDNKDFIAQMAQFTSVEQMTNIAKNTEKSAEKTDHMQQNMAQLANEIKYLREDMTMLTGRDDKEPISKKGNVKETLEDVKEINQKLLNEVIKLNKAIAAFE